MGAIAEAMVVANEIGFGTVDNTDQTSRGNDQRIIVTGSVVLPRGEH